MFGKLCVSGPNIYSQSMASLSGDMETPFNLTTTGHQLLLRWSSDHGTNRRGFHIRYVGEYQSMYPIYNNILLLLNAFVKQVKIMGLELHNFYFFVNATRTLNIYSVFCTASATSDVWPPHDFYYWLFVYFLFGLVIMTQSRACFSPAK